MAVEVPFYQIDTFASVPYAGNSTAVCLVSKDAHSLLSPKAMRTIAEENNLSETAYVFLKNEADTFTNAATFRLRWFEATLEDFMCGHGTLAAAAALFFELGNEQAQLTFETACGPLTVSRPSGASNHELAMVLPAESFGDLPSCCPGKDCELVQALAGGLQVRNIRNIHMVESVHFAPKLQYLVIVLREGTTYDDVVHMTPDLQRACAISQTDEVVGAVVTACTHGQVAADNNEHVGNIADKDVDVCSRYFGPWTGLSEDPVTGSAHALLAPLFCKRLGRTSLRARQGSQRQGTMLMEWQPGSEYVTLRAEARTVIRGNMVVPPGA